MKMPTIVGIFIFIIRDNFMLIWVEYEKKFFNLGAMSILLPVGMTQTVCWGSGKQYRP